MEKVIIKCAYCEMKDYEYKLRTYNPTLETVCSDCLQKLLETEYNIEIPLIIINGKKGK